jgi:hypothetical protein
MTTRNHTQSMARFILDRLSKGETVRGISAPPMRIPRKLTLLVPRPIPAASSGTGGR